MNRIIDLSLKLLNLRSLIAIVAIWLCMGLPQPKWLEYVSSKIDHGVFHLAMDLSDLPLSQSHITVVHVPSVEYDSWLADIPGAERLERLLDVSLVGDEQRPVIGVVLEQPLSMIQSQAESLLMDIQQGRRTHDHLFGEVNELLSRREKLVKRLQGNQVVLGVEQALYSGRISVQITDDIPWAAEVPGWLQGWLWRPAPNAQDARTTNPVFDYVSIWPQTSLFRSLVAQSSQQAIPGFELTFLQAAATERYAEREKLDAVDPLPILWQRENGFRIGDTSYRASIFGDVIPLYGSHSNMRSALRQLSLDAALDSDDLSGWILIGRDGSDTLELLAQSIAAMADGAQIIEPLWWSPLQKVLLLVLALLFCFVVPAISRYWKVTSVGLLVFGMLITALLAQSLSGYWLPVAELILYLLFGVAVISIWQRQSLGYRKLLSQLQKTKLDLADQLIANDSNVEALEILHGCRMQNDVLPRLYKVGQALAEKNQLEPAIDAYGLIVGYKRRYKDVQKKIQQLGLQKQTETLLEEPAAPVSASGGSSIDASAGVIQPTRMVGRYEIKKELKRGGDNAVLLGYDPQENRDVLIKTLGADEFYEPASDLIKAKFLNEAKIARMLDHPSIEKIYDIGDEGNLAYVVTAYSQGQLLRDYLHFDTLLPVVEVYKIVMTVAEALHFAHQQKIIHGHVEPDNILYLSEPFSVVVQGFGASGASADFPNTCNTSTNPLYLAPEQLTGEKSGGQTDVFSLGVVFYQLLTGGVPFRGSSAESLRNIIVNAKHQSVRQSRPDLPGSATRIANMALQKTLENRFSSAGEFAEALRSALQKDFGVEVPNKNQ